MGRQPEEELSCQPQAHRGCEGGPEGHPSPGSHGAGARRSCSFVFPGILDVSAGSAQGWGPEDTPPPSVKFQGLCKDPRLSAGSRRAGCDFTLSHAWLWLWASSSAPPTARARKGPEGPTVGVPEPEQCLGLKSPLLVLAPPLRHAHVHPSPTLLQATSSIKSTPAPSSGSWSPGPLATGGFTELEFVRALRFNWLGGGGLTLLCLLPCQAHQCSANAVCGHPATAPSLSVERPRAVS